jgi:hypothetical protein
MSKSLFELSNFEKDNEWIIKEFFNSVYLQGEFVSAVNSILGGRSFIFNEEYCLFPEPQSADQDLHFEGAKFGIMENQVVITNDALIKIIHAACNRYIHIHPENKHKLPNFQLESDVSPRLISDGQAADDPSP